MAQETPTEAGAARMTETRSDWQAGVAAGLIGGLAMGVLMTFTMVDALEAAIPALVGLSGGIAGWIVHMSISAVFGVVFAAGMTTVPRLSRYLDQESLVTSIGVGYGVLLWVVAAGVVMPLWLFVVGGPELSLPFLTLPSLVVHLAYGFVLGGTFPYLR